ncbi:hypothetical protein LU293_00135 [Moraxella nasovis]|uniref:hypothetical protein n=1 Tax=Moraxella nasovis TaxID=2904121 RepID=UPI001F6051A8|nr:hypothetical protein [Moraxella nasovis]UNU73361.1 hypothetical protein LU293_00135 [Moraxella nasovis]
MILDLPPATAIAIIETAKAQGITTDELLQSVANSDDIWLELDKHGLNSDGANLVLTEKQALQIIELLENPPSPTPPYA